MLQHLRACLTLLVATVLLCCVSYPLALLGIGKAFFAKQAEGSFVEHNGKTVGSSLIAQPFTADRYFQPRPSAVSYNAAGSGASNWAANNYLLRDRVARQLGPIVKYASGPKKGKPVADDIVSWFQKDRFAGNPGIVAQWSGMHSTVAQNWLHDWVKADKLNAAYVADWEAKHADEVAKWKKDNDNSDPKPEDLAAGIAGGFFASFSNDHPGAFPGVAEYEKDGTTAKTIGPVKEGSDIQSLFFDMWLTEHAEADLEKVPADMVMASGSGLDPHITLDNAIWQLDNRVADGWARYLAQPGKKVQVKALQKQIHRLLQDKSFAPLGGRVGVELVNVLEINLVLEDLFQKLAAEK